jgi:hypothetical protein
MVRLYCDNVQTIKLVTQVVNALHTRLRHVDIHNHWLRQEVAEGRIDVTYTPTDDIVADGLTKALLGSKFERFRDQLGIKDVRGRLKARQDTLDDVDIVGNWPETEVDLPN